MRAQHCCYAREGESKWTWVEPIGTSLAHKQKPQAIDTSDLVIVLPPTANWPMAGYMHKADEGAYKEAETWAARAQLDEYHAVAKRWHEAQAQLQMRS